MQNIYYIMCECVRACMCVTVFLFFPISLFIFFFIVHCSWRRQIALLIRTIIHIVSFILAHFKLQTEAIFTIETEYHNNFVWFILCNIVVVMVVCGRRIRDWTLEIHSMFMRIEFYWNFSCSLDGIHKMKKSLNSIKVCSGYRKFDFSFRFKHKFRV